jgi:ABC-type Fe3+-siderophore transport system permease subunit
MRRTHRGIVLTLALAAASVFAASAFAAGNGTLCKVYCKKGTSVVKQVNHAQVDAASHTATSGGQLPFTGLDLGFVALAGVLLVVAGFGLQRATRKPPAQPPTG